MHTTAQPRTPQHTRAVLMLLLANLFWGLSFPLMKAIAGTHLRLLPDSDTWFVTACTLAPRFLLGGFILGLLCHRQLRFLSRSEWKQGAGLGLFAFSGMVFQTDGLMFTSASTSAFLTQLYAIMIPVWLALRARRGPSPIVWLSCVLVLAGVAVLAQLDWRDLRLGRGELETLIGSIFFMGQILWLDRAEFAGNRPLPVTSVMFAVEGIAATAMAFIIAPTAANLVIPWTSGAWLGFTALLTALCTIGAYTIMNTWQPKITATEAGLIYCVEPVFASLLALFLPAWFAALGGFDYPNEVATTHLLLGGGLITAANVLIQLKPPAKIA
jgi:drug/metabolite transporter (DMT)-like permease